MVNEPTDYDKLMAEWQQSSALFRRQLADLPLDEHRELRQAAIYLRWSNADRPFRHRLEALEARERKQS